MVTQQTRNPASRGRLVAAAIVCVFAIGMSLASAQTLAKPKGQMPAATVEDKTRRRATRVETSHIAVTAEKTFGLRLLRTIVARKPGSNVFISPLSVFLALQMAGDGSAAATRAAMWKALALPDRSTDVLDRSTREMQSLLLDSDRQGKLNIANALWADRRLTLAPGFANRCQSVFRAHAASLAFADPGASRQINNWVSENTDGKISDIVTPAMVAKATMMLTNAVYFSGAWDESFPPAATERANFHKTDGAKTVSMMHRARLSGAYRSGDNFEGAMLRYKGSGLSFYALLPRQGKAPKDVLASLDLVHLAGTGANADLDLKLPRIALNSSDTLGGYLKTMGMEIAFRSGADFSGMGPGKIFLTEVIHKTRLEVDEKGTLAAAATVVTTRAGSARKQQPPPVKTIVFNRPFVVLIADASTGALVFAGVIENP
jgi:serine protease inhibitor